MKEQLLPEEYLVTMAAVIKLIGHPQRLRLLEYLDLHGECNVTKIVEGIAGQQGAISQHLHKLRAAGVVSCRRAGRQVLCRLASDNAVTILNCLRRKCSQPAGDCPGAG